MHHGLDRSSGTPTYLQLVQQVHHALRTGVLAPGDKLPTAAEVVTKLAINPNTVLKAYRELEREGLVVPRPGQGTFVERTLGQAPLPAFGRARVFGMPPDSARALARVAFVAQDKPLYDTFRVTELLRLGRALNPQWDNDYAVRRLAELQIPDARRSGKLSGGQQTQVAITLALASVNTASSSWRHTTRTSGSGASNGPRPPSCSPAPCCSAP